MTQDNTPPIPRKAGLRVPGHAYRPINNSLSPYNRTVTPACECGAVLLNWPVVNRTSREIHAQHKAAVVREKKRLA